LGIRLVKISLITSRTLCKRDELKKSISLKEISDRILEWGADHVEEFPWRRPSSAYESAIAEMMLMRTTPGQVMDVYSTFLEVFPGVEVLNEAQTESVNKIIEPLGLAWRVRLMKEMASQIVNDYEGTFPRENKELRELQGIGQYSAAAIRIFYFLERDVLLDSNTIRFFERFAGNDHLDDPRRDTFLYEQMNNLTPRKNVRKFAESFLDFMRLVCKPKNPDCAGCPLNKDCHYYNNQ
jgi:A/G-specific adenine glycosylase